MIAPDLRGFGLSAKPQGVAEYNLTDMLTDVILLMEYLPYYGRPAVPDSLAAIVAHDYGTALGTVFAALTTQGACFSPPF